MEALYSNNNGINYHLGHVVKDAKLGNGKDLFSTKEIEGNFDNLLFNQLILESKLIN
jgi:hypothetical protein